MCIAIVKPKDKIISEETLRICNEANPDGCGFAYCDNGTVYIKKFLKFENFLEEYKKVEGISNMLIHFRITTHGGTNIENTHPFKLNSKMALVHNGVISGYGERGNGISDTRDFINKVIGNISHKMWKNPSFIKLVEDAIGYSKFGILDTEGNVYIVNESKGVWDNGIWFSNSSYKSKKKYTNTTTTTTTTTQDTKTIEKKDNSDCSNKSYDDLIKVLWYCKDCKKEYVENERYAMYSVCPDCGSYKCEDIGWVQDGKKYYYNESYSYYM